MNEQTRQLEKLARKWTNAELKGDTGFLARTLAEDFVAIGPRGFMLTKEQWLSRHETGNLKYESFGLDEVAVRTYGDAAVVTGRETADGRYEDGEARHEIQEQFRVSLVFVKQVAGWLIAGAQMSPIAGPPGVREQ